MLSTLGEREKCSGETMQGVYHHQHQLAALLAAALPKEDLSRTIPTSSSSAVAPTTATVTPVSEEEESSRLAALTSLHRAVLYPPNSLLVTHSASYLAKGFSQLISDKLYSVRLAAATAYGALCSVLCSISIASNGRQNHVVLGSLIDQFIGWSLQSLINSGNETSELALESLHEFLDVGDVGAVERYALPILKACQGLIEHEKTSVTLLQRLLGVLTLISLKFFRCFQSHFVDIVDILLGWAMVPDLEESDKCVIMDSFLQFQKHWVNNMKFSLGLLSKFLGDMDVLLQDGSSGTSQQFKRLLALLSCFCTVLQSVASGLLEINFLEQINGPLCQMVPVLLRCLSLIGKKFGWPKWIKDSWRCLTLLAEILSERFADFYLMAADTLFQSLEVENANEVMETETISTFQVHGVLKTNLQLLSLQKLGLMPSSVLNILRFEGPISHLRLHPKHQVTGSAAATYIFLLQHGKNDVVEKTMDSLIDELQLLKCMLEQISIMGDEPDVMEGSKCYSKSELVVLIKFNMKVLLSCVTFGPVDSLIGQLEIDTLCVSRAQKLVTFMSSKLDPFSSLIESSVELQVTLLRTFERLATIELVSRSSIRKQKKSSGKYAEEENVRDLYPAIVFGPLRRYSKLLIKSLCANSPFAVKIEALKWVHKFCENVIKMYKNIAAPFYPCQVAACWKITLGLLFSILSAASDKEPKVRYLVAVAIEMLLMAKFIHPMHFPIIADVIIEKLGDPETHIKNTYLKKLSHVLPMTTYTCGLRDFGLINTNCPRVHTRSDQSLHWKQLFSLKKMPQQLHSHQLISILSYISQRWKVPLSTWIHRLIYTCCRKRDPSLTQQEDVDIDNGLWWDIKVEEDTLERICSVNHLAGVWWAIHEAARFCVTTRLRTNLGGPTQTFAALERMLLDIAHVLRLETDQHDGKFNVISSYAHLLPMRLFLEFVEALKKNVYNAYEGSTILSNSSRQSLLFFRANKKVCEEWFSRISEPMMAAGLKLQCQDATIHYCSLRLVDLSNFVASTSSDKSKVQASETLQNIRGRYAGDILRIIRNMTLALCRKREPEVLVGIQKWATIAFSPLFKEENQYSSDSMNLDFSWITGLVYQAGGEYEKAAAHYIHLLQTEESLSSMGSDGVQFAIARIIESYTAISDWKSLESWLLELQTVRAKYAGKSYAGALTMAGNEINLIQALACFDEGNFQAAWSYLDLTPKNSNELTLDPRLALQRSEQMLLQAMLLHVEGKVDMVSHELRRAKSLLEETFSVLPLDGLVDAAPHVNQLYCIFAFEESCKHGDNQSKPVASLLNSYIQTGQFPCVGVYQECSLWLKVLRVHQNTLPTSPMTLELCKNLMILARKQSNLRLATRLSNYLKSHVSLCLHDGLYEYFTSILEYEAILVMRAENKEEEALTNLWSFVCPFLVYSSFVPSDSRVNVLKAKACLKLSKWLIKDYSCKNLEGVVLKMRADFTMTEITSGNVSLSLADGYQSSKSGVNLIIQELAGTARKLSTHLCPSMGKSWILYGSWCYDQARASVSSNCEMALHSCSVSSILASEMQHQRFALTKEEQLHVESIILEHTLNYKKMYEERGDYDSLETGHSQNESDLKLLLRQIIDAIETAAGAPETEDYDVGSLSATLSIQLQKCFSSSTIVLEEAKLMSLVRCLVDVWWSLRRRRVSLFGHAAQAFMNYLSYSSLKCFDGQLSSCDVESNYKYPSYTLRAILYVLHIIVNYGAELKDKIEPALSMVLLPPLEEITPQVFARLSSHPNKVVRKQLENLLITRAKLSPWSLVYPTLVDVNSQEKEPSEEIRKIHAYLNKLYPRLVQDAHLMIKELENVSVLWEELWLGTLQDLHSDVMRRINLLKEEAARIAENTTLSHGEKNKINAAKYSAMMAPIFVVLERRLTSTSRKPETPHEARFLEVYQETIKSAVAKFKAPPASVVAIGDVWRPFENIAASLASYQKKSSVSLGEASPQLSSLSTSCAPMPGLEKQITISESESDFDSAPPGIVTISSFSAQISILPTKTKPKKIVLVGSDGMNYTYLLKGREDLRLDARIMQLLQAVNGFLQSSAATRGQPLGIRYYSVTPISGRAGLIQWVDNVISIYSVFKSWQNRAQLSQLSAIGADTKSTAHPVARPSDMFYGKIIPALKEKGIRRVISRRDWPHEVKRKVLLDLMKETPKQLLYQELWCASEGFQAFNSKLKRYSGSVAAMSIVGHILGLGDRHLDNILVDFCRGDIVHIDYNVCFDKGQRLKIPEIVPFRLTQTVEAALGLTGMEGSFRANCEAVLGVLRKNKDVILMLLEVFVWDPLVEWTRANFHDDAAIVGEERRGMEVAVSLRLFASRVQEIRIPLQEHHDLFLSTFPDIEVALQRFADALSQYEIVSGLFYCADQERSTIALHETSAKLTVAEATCNSVKTLASVEMLALEFAQAQAIVMEKGREAATWIEQHGMILDALRSSSIPEIKACIKLTGSGEALSLTSAVLVAGVPLTVVPEPTQIQCHDIDREISHLVMELDYGLSSAVAALQMYSLVLQRILPLNYFTTSPVHGWAQIMLSLNKLSPDIISVALRQGAELVTTGHTNGSLVVKNSYESYDDLCLKVTNYAADIERLEEECSELANSIGQGTESKAKERLIFTFVNYMHSERRQEALIHEGTTISALHGDIEEKRESILSILNTVLNNFFTDVKHRISRSLDNSAVGRNENTGLSSADLRFFSSDFEKQIKKCALVTEFLKELKGHVGLDVHETEADANNSSYTSQESWASLFKTNLLFCNNFVRNMIEVVVPSVIKSVISFNSDVMDIFGSISQIRGSIETSLEQFIQVELEKASLIELEQNYFVKVGLITEQQFALEEAAVKGRDHLSWEEAEELASQEEACRVQLEKLHQMWNEKDLQNSLLMKKEASINSTLISSEHKLKSLISSETEMESHMLRKKGLLGVMTESFSELESIDQALISAVGPLCHSSNRIPYLAEMMTFGLSISEYIWKLPSLPRNYAFLIWKVSMMDLLLDSCTHDVATSFDQNLGFEQLVDLVKKKLSNQLQERVGQYLKERVVPLMLTRLDTEIEMLREKVESSKDHTTGQTKIDHDAVARVQFMLEEYCNAHETVRAAISAASIMKKQVNDLKDALLKTSLEISQMEWMYDITSRPLNSASMSSYKFMGGDDNLLSVILNISRSELLEKLQSAATKIGKSLERLQSCEGTSIATEGQLERAMSWACGGPNSSPAGNSGIPTEFHDHLINRRHLLQGAQENASEVMKVCTSILEFEASRHDIFRTTGEFNMFRTGKDGIWEQSFLNALTKLDVTYHSFTRAEQEWKQAKSNMEAASSGLVSATNELRVAALKAKSASGNMQSTLLAMRESACETSVALSTYSGIIRGHSTLTSECGAMLEEVLAITEALHDVHSLGKEASALHSSLMQNLSKASAILLPLESLLSKDVAAMTDVMAREKETNLEIAPIHGQAIFQSYHNRIKEALLGFKPLVPPLILSVEELYSKLTRLARAAGLHAGNLHKALEGLGESLQVSSQDVVPSKDDLANHATVYDTQESGNFSKSDSELDGRSVSLNELCLPDRGWISPPESIDSGSTESGITSTEASLADSFSGLSVTELLSGETDNKENGSYPHCMPSLVTEVQDLPLEKAEAKILLQESSVLVNEDEAILLNKDKAEEESRGASFTNMRTVDQARGSKNAYAMSVLRRVEMKLDGRDITETSHEYIKDISIAEQVDFLIRQATNIDNLCNMYEGWTPWI